MKKWRNVLEDHFLDCGVMGPNRKYINLKRVRIGFDLEHAWFRCTRCSELTAREVSQLWQPLSPSA